MHEGTLFSEVKLDGVLLSDCELVYGGDNIRLFCKPESPGCGFLAVAVEFVACTVGEDHWLCKDLRVEQILKVKAAYDGVRHLWVGQEDTPGYIYYPDPAEFAGMFNRIGELENKYCSELG